MPEIAAVLLAAGEASRFGSPKQLARLGDGRTLIEHAVDKGRAVAGDHLYVVLGAHREQIEPLIADTRSVINPDWEQGMGSSVACAARHLETLGYEGLLIYLCDQVALEAAHLTRLCRAFGPDHIVCADYNTVAGAPLPGVPALFPSGCLPALQALDGDSGARKLLRGDLMPVEAVRIPEARLDIDTPEQLAGYLER